MEFIIIYAIVMLAIGLASVIYKKVSVKLNKKPSLYFSTAAWVIVPFAVGFFHAVFFIVAGISLVGLIIQYFWTRYLNKKMDELTDGLVETMTGESV